MCVREREREREKERERENERRGQAVGKRDWKKRECNECNECKADWVSVSSLTF